MKILVCGAGRITDELLKRIGANWKIALIEKDEAKPRQTRAAASKKENYQPLGCCHGNEQLKRRVNMSAKRDAYVKKLKARLDAWNADIDKLAAKAARAEAEAKIEYQRQLDDLRAKRDDVRDKLAAVQQAGEGAWEDLKEGLENSWDILKMSFNKAKTEFAKGYKKGTKE